MATHRDRPRTRALHGPRRRVGFPRILAAGLALASLAPSAAASTNPPTLRLLVGITSQASARAGGGTLETVAIVRVTSDRVTLDRVLDASSLPPSTVAPTGLDPGYTRLFGHSLVAWPDLAMAPDGPTVGSSWVQAWRAATGQRLDGAMEVEATALARMLTRFGLTLRTPRGEVLRTDSALARELTIGMRLRTPGTDASSAATRTDELAPALRALASHGATGLLAALRPSIADGRAWIYRTDATAQRALETAGLAGWIGSIPAREVRFRLNNLSGNRADAFLRATMRVRHPSPDASIVTVRLHLLPGLSRATSPLVSARADAQASSGPGELVQTVYSVGLAVHTSTVLVNGHHIVTRSAWYDGHPTVVVPVDVVVGADVTMTYTMTGRADISHALDGALPSPIAAR